MRGDYVNSILDDLVLDVFFSSSFYYRVESDDLSWHIEDAEGTPSVAEAYADELLITPEGRLAIKVQQSQATGAKR